MRQLDLERAGRHARDAISEVLETMVGLTDTEAGDPTVSDGSPPAAELTAFIGLTGGLKGTLAIQASGALGRSIAAEMLCIDDLSELSDDDLRDAFGEVANMAAGVIKSRMVEDGFTFDLAIPVVAMAPEPIAVQYRLASSMISVDIKSGSDILRVILSIAENW